jgi:hypothetical protein
MFVTGTGSDHRRIRRRHLLVIADHAKQVFSFGAAQCAAALG